MTPLVSISIAKKLHRMGKPFKIKMENTTSRNAFWETHHNPRWGKDTCEIRWGQIGKKGWNQKKTISDALDKAQDKLDGDYDYAALTNRSLPTAARRSPTTKTQPAVKLVGPYAEIRLLRGSGPDRFDAFDAQGNWLLSLDQAGAEAVAEADPFRIKLERWAG